MTDEEIKKELDACYAAEKQIEEDFLKAKQVFKENGKYKGDFSNFEEEIFEGLMFAQHIGYVNVELLPNVVNTIGHYSPTKRHFKVKDNSEMKILVFGEQTIYYNEDNEDEYNTYLVCQWCNFEDDYKGYILLPMKDGKGFAPVNGICYCCHQQIYSAEGREYLGDRRKPTGRIKNGISVEQARAELTTGCPFCHRSFVD